MTTEPPIATLLEATRVALEGKQRVHPPLDAAGDQPAIFHMELDYAFDELRALFDRELVFWESLPNKALEGALIGGLMPLNNRPDSYPPIAAIQILLETDGDTKVQALKAVLEWLRERLLLT